MIFQAIRMAFKAITANKTRAFLTMLGIIIGVMSLVVLVSLVTSATSSVEEQIASIGRDRLTVSIRDDKGNPIKASELRDFVRDDSIALVAPSIQSSGTVKKGDDTTTVSVTGTNNDYFHIEGNELAEGRFITEADLDNVSYVTVLSYEAANDIYGTTDAVGSTMTMDGRKYLVVGVLAEENSITSGFSQIYPVYIPYSVAERISTDYSGITQFNVAAVNSGSTSMAQLALESKLSARFKQDSDAYYVMNMDTLASTMSNVTNIFALLLGGIAAISLLVGGIGIMNIMLVSVTERTREIGIRKAIGAKRGDILLQFLIESLVICLIGCAIGIFISGVILTIANAFTPDTMVMGFSGGVVAISILFSTFIGIVFGLYPARKAAKMHPIDALRYE